MSEQNMKPATAAKKLGIYLQATPEAFQAEPITREAFLALQQTPPEWLTELRLNGPHPRTEVARKLGVSVSGLSRAGMADAALTTAEIKELLTNPPAWLVTERATQAEVRAVNQRTNERNEGRKILAAERAAEEQK
ncbi:MULTISPECIES: DUF5997 family protein [Mycetocola]|uniref:DUF5997 family protein n=1 Tax=Mycetocola TaxID=76634 RepID=UPI0005BDE018|nr:MULTISPECIES: DUF5997 family protein [Mycetocola]MCS4277146.1 hypothetical protein [Mycetocola sp. BIGb0189]